MVWYLSVFLCCIVLPVVFSDEVVKLKSGISEMQEHAKLLNKENEELNQKLQAEKQQCEVQLRPLQQAQQELHSQQVIEALNLQYLAGNLSQRHIEEAMLVKALNIEDLIRRKYSLKIELYSQELEMYGGRKRSGIADKCHLLKPLFQKYESSISPRSISAGNGMRKIRSNKDFIIVLQNEFNQHKLVVQGLQNKNNELKIEIVNFAKLCEAKKMDLQKLLEASEAELKETLKNVDLFQMELKEVIEVIQGLKVELQKLKEHNKQLKAESLQLKSVTESFANDLECYRKIYDLKINYQ